MADVAAEVLVTTKVLVGADVVLVAVDVADQAKFSFGLNSFVSVYHFPESTTVLNVIPPREAWVGGGGAFGTGEQ